MKDYRPCTKEEAEANPSESLWRGFRDWGHVSDVSMWTNWLPMTVKGARCDKYEYQTRAAVKPSRDYFRHPSKGWGWWNTSERPSPVLMCRLPIGCGVQVGAPVYVISEAEATEIERLRRELDAERGAHASQQRVAICMQEQVAELERLLRDARRQITHLEEHNQFKQCREWHEWAVMLLRLDPLSTPVLTASYKRQLINELVVNLRGIARIAGLKDVP